MKKLLLIFLVTMLPKVVNANPDKVCINGLYFDCFNYYGANTCRFTADFNGVASSTYTGRIEIPSTITYQNVTYTVRKIGANVFYNSGVTSVYLPNTITQFDGLAFEGATNLKYIVSAIEDPQPSNGDNYPYADYIFGYSGVNESCILVVPQGTKSTYTTKNWAKNVKGGVYENAYFKLDNKTRSYGNANPTLTYSYATLEEILNSPTYSCNATNTSPVGNYQISFDNKVGVVASGVATFVDGTLTVTKAPLTITAKSYTIKQGEALPSFEATYSGFKNGQTSSVLTTQPAFNCSATSSSAPGTYDITVSGAAAQNYSFNYVKGTLTITQADAVTVTAKSYSRQYGEANPAFEYTSSGAALSGTPSITCTATATSPVGDYPIVITKGSVTNYNDTYVNGTLTVTKAPLTITAKSYSIKQGEALPAFEAEYSGFKNSETSSVLTTQPTITTSATSASEPGTYDIIVSGASATNYDITYVKGTLTITQADAVTVTAKSYSRQYGESNPAFEYTSSGAALSGTPSITCTATATSPVGDYPIVITKGSVTNYNDTYVNGVLTVTKAPLTITAKSYSIKQGDALPTFEAEYSGFKNSETASVLTTQPTITTSATSASAPGTYDIIVSGAVAGNYDITYVKGTLTITQADVVTVTAKSYSRQYGESNPAFEYTSSGAALSGTPSIICEATATSPVGDYPIVITKGSVTNYNDSYVNGTLTVTKAPLTITAKSYSIKQGEALPAFEAEYTGFKNSETSSVLTTQPTITTSATSASEPGTYDIVVSEASATNYDITYVKGTLTITQADVVTVTAKSYSRQYGEANPAFEYTSSGATLTGTPSISCAATATSPVGDYPIVITKGSVTNYNDTYVNGVLTVTKAPLTITAKSYTIKQGDALPAFEAEYTGFKNGETSSVLTTQPTINCSATSSSAPGTYDIIVSGAAAQNYSFNYVNGTLTIEANVNIQFADNTVKSICVANWDTNGDGELSYDEAAVVTDLGEVFKQNVEITSFNELQYFTELTNIGERAFVFCTNLTSIIIPNSVTSIGDATFYGCGGLTSISIPNSVMSIGYQAFSSCSSLTSINVDANNPTYDSRGNCNAIIETSTNTLITGCKNTIIPNNVTSIGVHAFSGCSALTSISIPNSVTSIGGQAFYGCFGLTSIEIPNSVTSMNSYAFAGCSGLTSITIPNSVMSIGYQAFSSCSGLTSINVDANNPTYDSRGNCNAIIETSTNTLITGCKNTIIPNNVTSIGAHAFSGCSALTSISIPNSVTSISESTFYNCSGLTSIIIPNSVTSIGNDAFQNCSSLTSVTVGFNSPLTITENTFSNRTNATLYVPAGSKTAYQAADYWKQFKEIVEFDEPFTLTANNLEMVYGDALPEFTYTTSGGTFSGTPQFTCEATSTSPVGTYPIVVSQGTIDNDLGTYVNGTLTITKAPLTITAKSYSIKQGEALPAFEAEYSGFKNSETSSVLTTQPTITTSATSASEPGTYDIVVSGASATNYDITYVKGTLTITPNSTGIIEISVENPVDVYNIQGNKVRSKATTLSDLPTGVYIVNGRKVIVK